MMSTKKIFVLLFLIFFFVECVPYHLPLPHPPPASAHLPLPPPPPALTHRSFEDAGYVSCSILWEICKKDPVFYPEYINRCTLSPHLPPPQTSTTLSPHLPPPPPPVLSYFSFEEKYEGFNLCVKLRDMCKKDPKYCPEYYYLCTDQSHIPPPSNFPPHTPPSRPPPPPHIPPPPPST